MLTLAPAAPSFVAVYEHSRTRALSAVATQCPDPAIVYPDIYSNALRRRKRDGNRMVLLAGPLPTRADAIALAARLTAPLAESLGKCGP